MLRKHAIAMMVIVESLVLVGTANAVQYSFFNITNNSSIDAAIGEAQLFVDVTDTGHNQVLFTYRNIGPLSSSITDIYVDDGSILGIATIFNTPGLVEFSEGPSPRNLPGANLVDPPFVAIRDFSVDSDSPVQPMGINPGESLGILYDIIGGRNFSHVLGELGDGSLRLGLHVQGFASGGSEAYVNTPEPMTLALMILGGLPMILHRRNQH